MSSSRKVSPGIRKLQLRANELLRDGKHEDAIRALSKLVKKHPSLRRERKNLAILLSNAGRYKDSLPHLGFLQRQSPGDIEILSIMAVAQQQYGLISECIETWYKALAIEPANPVISRQLAEVLRSTGETSVAADVLGDLLAYHPMDERLVADTGALLIAAGRCHDAVGVLDSEEINVSSNTAVMNNLMVALDRTGRTLEARNKLKPLITTRPEDPGLRLTMATLCENSGDYEQAEENYLAAIEHSSDPDSVRNDYALMLGNTGRSREAVDILTALTIKTPGNCGMWNNLGHLCSTLGEFNNADTAYRKAVSICPTYGDAWRNLGLITRYKKPDCDSDADAIKAALQHCPEFGEDAMHLNFALAKMNDDIGEYETAFLFMQRANRLSGADRRFSLERHHREIEEIKRYFSGANKEEVRIGQNDESDEMPTPVFVVGMPRSGTTLTERMLASHPMVYAAGELWDLVHVVRQMEYNSGKKFPACIDAVSCEMLTALRQKYLHRLAQIGPGFRYVCDKLPLNFRYVGLIRLLFPKHRIVHCVRDPMDVGLSIFRQHFPTGIDYATSLDHIGSYYCIYSDLMNHWRDIYPAPFEDVVYEELVRQPDAWRLRLFNYLGLDHEEEPADTGMQQIGTASVWQARQPVYRDASRKWKHYAHFLGELSKALQPCKVLDENAGQSAIG